MSNLTTLFTDIANAIREKKGTSDKLLASSFPSEIQSIESGLSINGISSKSIQASGSISKGDICELIPTSVSGYSATKIVSLPLSYTTDVPIVLDDGNFILCANSSYQYYPFYFKDGAYQQMKVNGASTYLLSLSSSIQPSRAYDSNLKRYYHAYDSSGLKVTEYQLDIENMNITTNKTYSTSSFNKMVGIATFAYKNNIFVQMKNGTSSSVSEYNTYQLLLNSDGTITTLDKVCTGTDANTSSSYYNWASQFTILDNDDLLVCSIFAYPTTNTFTSYVKKYIFDLSTGKYTAIGNYIKLSNYRYNYFTYTTYFTNTATFIFFNKTGTLLLYINNATTLLAKRMTNSLSTSDINLVFDDGLNTAKVARIMYYPNEGYLFVLSTDTNYTTEQQSRLYKINDTGSSTINCKFIGCPTEMFSPVVTPSTMPIGVHLNSGNYMYMKSNENSWYKRYELKELKADYDYTATVCSNKLSSSTSVSAYGIANEDMADGELGNIEVILSK